MRILPDQADRQAEWRRKHPKPQPPPMKLPTPISPAIVLGEDPRQWLGVPSRYRFLVTADLNYRHYYEDGSFFKDAREQGRVIESWCDCRPWGVGTPPDVAIEMMHTYSLDGWWGQGESSAEFDLAIAAGATRIIGNLSGLLDDRRGVEDGLCWYDPNDLAKSRRHMLLTGRIEFVCEDYWNCGWGLPNWQNLPVKASLIACYDASGEVSGGRYRAIADYLSSGRFVPGRDWVYAPGCRGDEVDFLRRLG